MGTKLSCTLSRHSYFSILFTLHYFELSIGLNFYLGMSSLDLDLDDPASFFLLFRLVCISPCSFSPELTTEELWSPQQLKHSKW